MRTLVIGDIHGAYRALIQCLDRSGFDKKKDRLICLGDVADGWSEVVDSVEELMTIENLIYVLGNHDNWLRNWLKFGTSEYMWLSQGGQASVASYLRAFEQDGTEVGKKHEEFFNKSVFHFVDEENRLFVHGGFQWKYPIEDTDPYQRMWDRHLFETAVYWELMSKRTQEPAFKVELYKEIFIGHTTTSYQWTDVKPVHVSNVWNLDQGAGWEGKLTIMDVDTKEYWQSDDVKNLYPDEKGRRG